METALKFLSDRGILLTDEVDYTEYLKNNFANNFFFIDQCPYDVDAKYGQVEFMFDEISNDKQMKQKFFLYELKFINIISTLWLYNRVLVSSDVGQHKKRIKKNMKGISRKNLNILEQKLSTSKTTEIVELEELELLVRLGVRNLAETEFYFDNYDLLIVPSWSCFIIYFNDLDKVHIIEKIINVHGLFLRAVDKT